MVVLPLRTTSLEIQEQPSQRRIVEGMAVAIIQIALGLGGLVTFGAAPLIPYCAVKEMN